MANHGSIGFFLGVLTLVFLAVLIAYVYYKLRSRRLDIIEKGLWRSEYERGILEPTVFAGLFLIAIGIAILAGVFFAEEIEMYIKTTAGLLPLFVGVALLLYYRLFEKGSGGRRGQG